MVEHETSTSKTKFEYNADYAQGKAVFGMTAKRAPLKLGKDTVLAEKIRDAPLSPFAELQKSGDTITVPNAWQADFIDSVRAVTVYGTLYITQPTR